MMKIRLRDNSIRLRLNQTEVTALANGDSIVSQTGFGACTALITRLAGTDSDTCSARFDGQRINITVPSAALENWARSETVSIDADQPLGDGQSLRILIEKDFACLTERLGEDDSDAFPHPGADSSACSGH